MKLPLHKSYRLFILLTFGVFLSGCSSFSGLRTPKFNGEPFVANEEKILAYQNSREIIGEEKEFYMKEPFSEAIYHPSLDFIDHEPVLLEEGTYIVGDDLPAGRVNIYGEAYNSNMTVMGEELNPQVQVPGVPDFSEGTLFIRDQVGDLYFENMFHTMYGNDRVQVDLIEGHTLEVVGVEPAFVVFYSEEIPPNPYIFDPRIMSDSDAELVEGQEELFDLLPHIDTQAIEVNNEENTVDIVGGIYEVGVHFEPGTYEITETTAHHHTQIFLFREGEETRVFEVADFMPADLVMTNSDSIKSKLELKDGDKIYPSYMTFLRLTRLDEE